MENNNYQPTCGQWCTHQYGGVYRVIGVAEQVGSGGDVVVYDHVWPFRQRLLVRPLGEWTFTRFPPISKEEAAELMMGDIHAAQQHIERIRAPLRKHPDDHSI